MNPTAIAQAARVLTLGLTLLALTPAWASEQPQVLTADEVQTMVDKTLHVHLAPDLSAFSEAEHAALDDLLAAGAILQRLYEHQKHPQALEVRERLETTANTQTAEVRNLRKLYRVFKGPIATTLDNQRRPLLPVAPEVPGKNLYPPDAHRPELEAAAAHAPGLLAVRTVVRRATPGQIDEDQATLERFPALRFLHDELAAELANREADGGFYAVPYAIAYAEDVMRVSRLLRSAAGRMAGEDPEFAAYLRHRALDLLTGDYEPGDASWVTGRFAGNLNAQIGSYETYDDALFGVKAFQSMSILKRDAERSAEVTAALGSIQEIENRLPYERHKRVRDDIPVGVYEVIADFGQARGTNTATILPNDAVHSRKYGRTILLRSNIMTHPEIFALARQEFEAATAPEYHGHLLPESGFQRTLWHEVGHYLGVDRTADGRDLDAALQETADLYEEMKADLASLFAAAVLDEQGRHNAKALRGIYAGGIRRVLQPNEPRREQPYQTMQLMQWNWFLDKGVLCFDSESGVMSIDYRAYPQAVIDLLREVLAVQDAGDVERAREFVERWTTWKNDLHEVVAAKIREALTSRYRYVTYEVVDGRW